MALQNVKTDTPSSLTKLNPEQEKEALDFVNQILGTSHSDFAADLKSGVVLCEFVNKLKPGSVKKINKQRMPFMQMENIGYYLDACRAIGIESQYLFVTVDLFEAKNLAIVALNILAVKRHFGYGFERGAGSTGNVFDKY
eukprot:TRINITY_DN3096_c0_g1_i1.p1 TRINITY_DN3096_c0_g1~~TRINITY_DN3096_c0_g1_i1.p1  ORF type:complete len:140 (-),score=23.05 TRINITY_DN3096_c0_g1_i1:214-633(-)